MDYTKPQRTSFCENEEEVNQEVITCTQPNTVFKYKAASSKKDEEIENEPNKSTLQRKKYENRELTKRPNWQAHCSTVIERNSAMLNNQLMSDVTFTIVNENSTKNFVAHKYVLATGSSVFSAMLYGAMAPSTTTDIEIIDVTPQAFQNLLEFLYTDEARLDSENILETLYAAKKYMVTALEQMCLSYLESSLSAHNACLLLSQGYLFEETQLINTCWEIIDPLAEEVLSTPAFLELDQPSLDQLLDRETLHAKEVTIFAAVEKWAEAQCIKQELPLTPENKRSMVGSSLYKLRLGAMKLEDFANGPAQSDLLTLEESQALFLHFTATKPLRKDKGLSTHPGVKLEFDTVPRTGLQSHRCQRFRSCASRNNQWRYRGRCDSIQFSVDKRVFIAAVGLYGSSVAQAQYDVALSFKTEKETVRFKKESFICDGTPKIYYVYFDAPFMVEPEEWYTISAVLDGSTLSYFGQEGQTEVPLGDKTFMFQCSADSTNGTGVQGGQLPEILYY